MEGHGDVTRAFSYFLGNVYSGDQTALFDDLEDGCESGYCMT